MIKSIPRVEREAAFRKIKDSQYGVFKNASDGSIKLVVNAALRAAAKVREKIK